ncbi:hypothetical protein DCC78_05705 [bacterium]|nr:MAG: hypothetical protein DCC78_05705 [bacterium]
MFQRQPAPSLVRRRRLAAPFLAVAFVLSFTAMLTTTAAEQHLSDPDFYKAALDSEEAYGRAYEDVLFDDDLTGQVEDLLGGVDIPEREIEDLVKEIVPPGKLRRAVEEAIDRVVEYMKTGRDLVLAIDVTAFVEAIAEAVINFTIEAVIALPEERSETYEQFVGEFVATLETLDGGGIPAAIPSYPIPEEDVEVVAGLVFTVGRIEPESELGEAVLLAVAQDDVAGALKVATASILLDLVAASVEELISHLDEGPDGELLLAAPNSVTEPLEERLELPRRILGLAAVGRFAAGALALASLAVLAVLYIPDWRRTARWCGGALAGAGVFTFAFWWIARGQLVGRVADIVVKKTPGFPQTFSTLVDDVLESAATKIDPTFQLAAAGVLVAGLLMVGASFVVGRRAVAA